MNHIYRVIWNEVAHSFVAVSEIAKARGKPSSTVGSIAGRFSPTSVWPIRPCRPEYRPANTRGRSCALTGAPAYALDIGALPTGGNVTAGAAAISQTANALTVQQSSQRAAIDWQSFSIGSAATVNFNQPNANAVALNRIIGNSATEIYGKLNANGQVFFSNPNGMLFAKGAQVNIGGILATTMNLNNEDFMAGNYRFTQSNTGNGSLRNEGLINALGGAALIGNPLSPQPIEGAITQNPVIPQGGRGFLLFWRIITCYTDSTKIGGVQPCPLSACFTEFWWLCMFSIRTNIITHISMSDTTSSRRC